jgi:FxsC-like protein
VQQLGVGHKLLTRIALIGLKDASEMQRRRGYDDRIVKTRPLPEKSPLCGIIGGNFMGRGFFFSYARANRDEYLDRFFKNLCDEAALKEYWPSREIGFFDAKTLETGTMWEEGLANALRTCGVLVAICSPDYVNSPYCGKEFQIFHERQQSYIDRRRPSKPPRFIFPVIWGHPSGSLRDIIRRYQLSDDSLAGGKFPAAYMEWGLHYLMKLERHKEDYESFITRLAHQIVDAAREHDLEELTTLRPLDEVASAFHSDTETEDAAGSRAWFAFVAGRPTELVKLRTVDRYRLKGGGDWRPFHPDSVDTVGLLAYTSAARQNLFYRELPADNSLLDAIKAARKRREIVVIVVDPWTLNLSSYNKIMEEYDTNNYENCALLVPWNAPDQETEQQREALRDLVGRTFRFKKQQRKLIYYRDDISSERVLKSELLKVLVRWKARYIETAKKTAEIKNDSIEQEARSAGRAIDRQPVVAGPGGNRR